MEKLDPKNPEAIKEMVREKYASVVETPKSSGCCGPSCCGTDAVDDLNFAPDYTKLEGYNPDADFGLGCGLPTEFAQITPGDTVVDLGSGAGNDCFIARAIVGEQGKVIGVDMTPAMIQKARANAQKLGFKNVEFRLGEIEALPVDPASVDVVVSNCVLNLVPNKAQALKETFRILKNGGHFSISDIVTKSEMPEGIREQAALYAGCISGALTLDEYIAQIKATGFTNVTIQKQSKINLPESLLSQHLSEAEVKQWLQEDNGLFSITVYAEKA